MCSYVTWKTVTSPTIPSINTPLPLLLAAPVLATLAPILLPVPAPVPEAVAGAAGARSDSRVPLNGRRGAPEPLSLCARPRAGEGGVTADVDNGIGRGVIVID